jgi:hypothetical protein
MENIMNIPRTSEAAALQNNLTAQIDEIPLYLDGAGATRLFTGQLRGGV